MCEYQKLYSFFHKALLVTAQRFALPAGRIGKNSLDIITPNFANCAANLGAIAPSGARFVGRLFGFYVAIITKSYYSQLDT